MFAMQGDTISLMCMIQPHHILKDEHLFKRRQISTNQKKIIELLNCISWKEPLKVI